MKCTSKPFNTKLNRRLLSWNIGGHPSLNPGPKLNAWEASPHNHVNEHHPARLPVNVTKPPTMISQPPVSSSINNNTAMARTFKCAVFASIVPLPISLYYRCVAFGVWAHQVVGSGNANVIAWQLEEAGRVEQVVSALPKHHPHATHL